MCLLNFVGQSLSVCHSLGLVLLESPTMFGSGRLQLPLRLLALNCSGVFAGTKPYSLKDEWKTFFSHIFWVTTRCPHERPSTFAILKQCRQVICLITTAEFQYQVVGLRFHVGTWAYSSGTVGK